MGLKCVHRQEKQKLFQCKGKNKIKSFQNAGSVMDCFSYFNEQVQKIRKNYFLDHSHLSGRGIGPSTMKREWQIQNQLSDNCLSMDHCVRCLKGLVLDSCF